MNYTIIYDKETVQEFIEFLPDLTEHETYYLTLLSRNKYTKDPINSRTTPLKRLTSDKKHMMQNIMQLECPIGSYTKDGVSVEPESLALYITTNPRCKRKAMFGLLSEIATNLKNNCTTYNPMSDTLTCINRAKSRSIFVTFDIDNKVNIDSHIYKIWDTVGQDAVAAIETHGGYHVLIRPDKVVAKQKDWYRIIDLYLSDKGVDQTGDILSPVPGTLQGNFKVTLSRQVQFKNH